MTQQVNRKIYNDLEGTAGIDPLEFFIGTLHCIEKLSGTLS